MSSRLGPALLDHRGVPTASAPDGTLVSLSTTALAATIAQLWTTTRCSTIDPMPTRHPDSIVQPSRWTRWPITQSSPIDGRVLDRGVQHAVVLDACPLADADLAVVAAQHRARPHRAVRADRDRCRSPPRRDGRRRRDGSTGPGRRGRRWARLRTVATAIASATASNGGAKPPPPDTVADLCPEGSISSSPARARTARGRGVPPVRGNRRVCSMVPCCPRARRSVRC